MLRESHIIEVSADYEPEIQVSEVGPTDDQLVERDVHLVRVYPSERDALARYIEAFYHHDGHYDSLVNIETGVTSLLRNEALATAYFLLKGNQKVGYVILSRHHSVKKGGTTFYVDELYVEEKFRRQGIGRNIIRKIIKLAQEEGVRMVLTKTEPYNDIAQEFLQAQGFRPNLSRNFERVV